MRATKGAARAKAKRRIFDRAKGYFSGRRKLLRTAMETIERAGAFAYRDRRTKKRDFRRLWITRLSAACQERGLRYSQFIAGLKAANITLDRPSDTLSGGELQRVRLASGIGSGLAGILYILDEPSIGLHPRDNQRLIAALRDLQANDSTVIVVEHDEAMMRQADWLIDIGPGGGKHGGQIVAAGAPEELAALEANETGRFLRAVLPSPWPIESPSAT